MKSLNQNIVFIGFMGCGKSSIAKAVSQQTGCLFVDTDGLIEMSENKKIKDIFQENSEKYFRECEKKVFDFLLPTKNVCISVGGGFPIYINHSLKSLGVIVYLKKSFDAIISSLTQKDIDNRPLLKDIDRAKKIYESRIKLYEKQADVILDITHQDINEVCLDIVDKLKI
ncbi:Shikimate kinase I [hydrothermal vent metagenome]|uniref:Shikimate kinase I n=1 Tax=hydrothermal vent metagenome TaxID=652676 RepID=A0A3B1E5Z7_9ZZZZ